LKPDIVVDAVLMLWVDGVSPSSADTFGRLFSDSGGGELDKIMYSSFLFTELDSARVKEGVVFGLWSVIAGLGKDGSSAAVL